MPFGKRKIEVGGDAVFSNENLKFDVDLLDEDTARLADLPTARRDPLPGTAAGEAAIENTPQGFDHASAARAVSPATAEEASTPAGIDDLSAARRAPVPATTAETSASTPDGLHDLSGARATLSATREEDTSASATAPSSLVERRLKECSEGDDFRLSSTVYASANGCYSETGSDTDAYVNAERDRIVFPASLSASSSGTEVVSGLPCLSHLLGRTTANNRLPFSNISS